MGFSAFIYSFLLLVASVQGQPNPQALPTVDTIATNMRFSSQQNARNIFMKVYMQHPEARRCEEFANAYARYEGKFFTKPAVCFKFPNDNVGGSYYVPYFHKYIQFFVREASMNYMVGILQLVEFS